MKTVKNVSAGEVEVLGFSIHPGGLVQVPDGFEHEDLVEVAEVTEPEAPKRKRALIDKLMGGGRSAKAKKG